MRRRETVGAFLLTILAAACAAVRQVGPTLFPGHDDLIFWGGLAGIVIALIGLAWLLMGTRRNVPPG